ncbi:Csu type fimbrial protein [Hydrogenophaga sp. PBL-H3]|uniref:Csu type fimbrial protein n=1 Tax=Hydrogenophaga sp. PBL-H3 TaxID=434010 RepID=UPI00131F9523|nr:spore coat U domain-containing protein [Hydrogenophaga sp. PBL-H3]QHE75085.1 spore coat protein U domain-containing protein [Hydrogenophaga sp. PBL-H3]QHE79512.1 spore coat protein U domain-containing protein [Hydrogenophaga sp. PBL-H3]
MKRLWLTCLLLLGALGAVDARASTCAVAVTPLAFGAYTSPGGPRVDSSASVIVTCTPTYLLLACNVAYTLSLSNGLVGSPGDRQMASGAGRLHFTLYSDAARSTPWGDGGASGGTVGGSLSTSLLGLLCLQGTRNHTVYGRIPANQSVPAGTYLDQVTLTITY